MVRKQDLSSIINTYLLSWRSNIVHPRRVQTPPSQFRFSLISHSDQQCLGLRTLPRFTFCVWRTRSSFSLYILELRAWIWLCWRGRNAPRDATKMELYAFTGPSGLGYNSHASIFRRLALEQQEKRKQHKSRQFSKYNLITPSWLFWRQKMAYAFHAHSIVGNSTERPTYLPWNWKL